MTTHNEIRGPISGDVIQVGAVRQLTVTTPGGREYLPMQLPPPPHAFVNRVDVLGAMDQKFAKRERGPLLFVLSGMAGVGKSAVAVHWAHTQRDKFAGGLLYVDLVEYRRDRGVGVGDMIAAFLRALGVQESYIPATRSERIAMFRSRTSNLPVLVLLDGVDEPAQVRSALPGSPDSVVIATSRHRLPGLVLDGAQFVDVGPLNAEDSARLMTRMLSAHRIDETAAMGELVRMCAGLPLALRVVGAGLTRHRRWSAARLVRHLAEDRERLGRLVIEGEDNSVAEMFDLTYGELSPDVQRLYCCLGVYPGPHFTSATAALVGQLAEPVAEELLESLCAANLIMELGQDRFQLHDLIKLHAGRCAERDLSADERQAVVRRTVDWYALGAAAADFAVLGPRRWRLAAHDLTAWKIRFDAPGAMAWLEDERPNLLAAVRAAASGERYDLVWQICESLWAFYHSRKHYSDWIEVHTLGIAAAKITENLLVEAHVRNRLARAYLELRDFTSAAKQLEEAKRLAAHDERAVAVVLESCGLLYREQECYSEAVAVFTELVARQRAAGDDRAFALQSYQLGDVLIRASRADQAVPVLIAALRAVANLSNEEMVEARVRIALGTAYHRLREYGAARTQLQSAVRVTQECGQPVKEAQALEELLGVAQDERDGALFRSAAERLHDLYVEAGNPRSTEVRKWIVLGARTKDAR